MNRIKDTCLQHESWNKKAERLFAWPRLRMYTLGDSYFFATAFMSTNDCRRAMSIDFGVVNKFSECVVCRLWGLTPRFQSPLRGVFYFPHFVCLCFSIRVWGAQHPSWLWLWLKQIGGQVCRACYFAHRTWYSCLSCRLRCRPGFAFSIPSCVLAV